MCPGWQWCGPVLLQSDLSLCIVDNYDENMAVSKDNAMHVW
jgi:hypothetical protein